MWLKIPVKFNLYISTLLKITITWMNIYLKENLIIFNYPKIFLSVNIKWFQ